MNMTRAVADVAARCVLVSWLWMSPPQAFAQLLPPVLPPLPGSLVVTITSPTSGSTVSSTVTVSASVSIVGSLTVANVEFFVDGDFIGNDTTASYSVPWDTKTVGNGSHTLTAVARDILGVGWTSAPVTVTVSNDKTPPTVSINQAAGQPDPTNTSPINFTVVFSEPVSGFTGADVTITGTAGGTKTVAVTGGPSTYNAAVSGMTNGTVIATIAPGVAQDAAGNANTASSSTDNTVTFETTAPPTVTRFEEDNSAISYSPADAWVRRGPEIAAFSGGTAVSSDVAGATATFTFDGTAVSWIGLKCNTCGIANVSIDDDAATSVNTAGAAAPGSPGLMSEVVFTASGLAAGGHTLVITVTGTTTSGGTHIAVDAFDVTSDGSGSPSIARRIEETDPAVSYTGNWILQSDPRVSGGTYFESQQPGARATLSFTGTAVSWISARAPVTGIARVFLDGALMGEVDTYAPSEEGQVVVFSAGPLPRGAHTLIIEVTGTKNPAAETNWIVVDGFDVPP